MSDENKAVLRNVYEALNAKNLDAIPELVTEDWAWHGPGQELHGKKGIKELVETYVSAFPDLEFSVDEMLADGDKVTTRWSAQGTHKGELAGIAATGKTMQINGINVSRLENGKIAEEWESFDQLGMMKQLGVISE